MSAKTRKRQAFAARQRQRRAAARVRRLYAGRPGFLGVVTGLTITTDGGAHRHSLGIGALRVLSPE